MNFDEVLATVRSLCGERVSSTLFDSSGAELVRWEGQLTEEQDAESMFLVGAKPFMLDRAELREAEAIPGGLRLHGSDGTVVELTTA